LELALNITWLVLSAALVLLTSVRKSPLFAPNRHRVAVAIALVCLIAFLFPIISITDDLNSAAMVAETPKSKRWAPAAELFAIVASGFIAAFSAQSSTWADGSILCETAGAPQELFSFHCSRRPPPAIS
jgi:hypothetical protein